MPVKLFRLAHIGPAGCGIEWLQALAAFDLFQFPPKCTNSPKKKKKPKETMLGQVRFLGHRFYNKPSEAVNAKPLLNQRAHMYYAGTRNNLVHVRIHVQTFFWFWNECYEFAPNSKFHSARNDPKKWMSEYSSLSICYYQGNGGTEPASVQKFQQKSCDWLECVAHLYFTTLLAVRNY